MGTCWADTVISFEALEWGVGGGEGLVYTVITHLEEHEYAGHHGDGHDGASRGEDGGCNVEHGHRANRRLSVHNASSSDKFCLSCSFCWVNYELMKWGQGHHKAWGPRLLVRIVTSCALVITVCLQNFGAFTFTFIYICKLSFTCKYMVIF